MPDARLARTRAGYEGVACEPPQTAQCDALCGRWVAPPATTCESCLRVPVGFRFGSVDLDALAALPYRYALRRMEASLKDGVLSVPLPARFQNRDDGDKAPL
jgi:hypothetical protein